MLFLNIIIIVLALIILMALHEFGHFIFAKIFRVKVEEFGIGYPPRIWGKKWGDTVYSLNLLPFGAFVKILGEEEDIKQKRSFSVQPLWKRMLVVLGGVMSFWVIAFLIYGFIMGFWGLMGPVDDAIQAEDTLVVVLSINKGTPADFAGLKIGDSIAAIKSEDTDWKDVNQVNVIKDFVDQNKGNKIFLRVKRDDGFIELFLVPRKDYPSDEGPMGIGLARIAKKHYLWHQVPKEAVLLVFGQTEAMVVGLKNALFSWFKREKVEGLQFVGPIGVGGILNTAITQGIDIFLAYIGMITVWLALFNLFPIPALDGGKILFLVIEGVFRKPVPARVEQKITAVFFLLLICLMIAVTIKDVAVIIKNVIGGF